MAGIRAAMSDLAETIRRVFQAPVSHPVSMAVSVPFPGQIPPLAALVLQPFVPASAMAASAELLTPRAPATVGLDWAPRVAGEPGWATWETGAKVGELPLFRASTCQRLAVPALPRRAEVRRERPEAMTARPRSGWNPFPRPGTRGGSLDLALPRSFRALDRIIGLPVAVTGEDLTKLSKALWMRYTLQMVRSTGENIRNLDVLGLYRIPVKGTRQVHHDAATGRLLVTLGPEAVSAARARFMLARRKNDGSVVCCFVEEG